MTLGMLKDQDYSFAMCKATQGTGFRDGYYAKAVTQAKRQGLLFAAYHFLEHGNIAQQADNLASKIGDKSIPVMIDCEPTGASRPTLNDCVAFRIACADHGIRVSMLYLPEWYWVQLKKPSLKGWTLVQSRYLSKAKKYGTALYTGDHDDRGWHSFGGVAPTIWQFASTVKIDGFKWGIDGDAFRGTRAELAALKLFKDYSGSDGPKKPDPTPPAGDRAEKAIAAARHQSAHGPRFPGKNQGAGQCLQRVREAYGITAIVHDAALSWEQSKTKHPTSNPNEAPRGAAHYWLGGSSGNGHIAIGEGQGECMSTDIKRNGYFDHVKVGAISSAWPKLRYVGWSPTVNGVRVIDADEPDEGDDELSWDVEIADWAPQSDRPGTMPANKALNQARGYAEDAYRNSKKALVTVTDLLAAVTALSDKVDRALENQASVPDEGDAA